jgi:hypothetical protein
MAQYLIRVVGIIFTIDLAPGYVGETGTGRRGSH